MNVFEAVKQSVTTRQAAEHYGIRVGRNGMCVCPFHDDKNPSMKVDRRFHCFGCQADGDVIDFVSRLENVSPREAALMLAQDFSIPYEDKEPPSRSRPKRNPRKESPEQQFKRINNEKVLLHDGQVLDIDGVRIECFLVPGHTWGHMVYLIDDKYIFIGDTLWFGADGGYSFISALAEDNKLAVKSLTLLEKKLKKRGLHPLFITGHTGWTDNMEFAFAHKNELCSPFKKKVHDPSAPYDAYDESDDTEENAKSGFLKGVGR